MGLVKRNGPSTTSAGLSTAATPPPPDSPLLDLKDLKDVVSDLGSVGDIVAAGSPTLSAPITKVQPYYLIHVGNAADVIKKTNESHEDGYEVSGGLVIGPAGQHAQAMTMSKNFIRRSVK